MMMTGAKILMECLLEQGVDTIFGYPGGTILNVYDELYQYSDKINHILTAHEQGASHAADGYYRATGKTGVCFATSGPGATNLTTGIATANSDSSAVVFITCNVSANLLGRDSFQEVDITGIAMPITKANYLVSDINQLADIIREAFYLASHGRPGPVLIDILKNVTAEKAEYIPVPKAQHRLVGHLAQVCARADHGFKSQTIDQAAVQEAAAVLASAKKPVLMLGGGVIRAGACEQARALAKKLDAVTVSTVMGLGAMDSKDPAFVGFVGMHGSVAANRAVSDCDVLLAIGTRFSDRVALNPAGFAKNAKIIHIDIDRAEINKNVPADIGITGDAKQAIEALMPMLDQQAHSEWKEAVARFRRKTMTCENGKLMPNQILEIAEKVTNDDAIIVTDVGQHQMWSAQYYDYKFPGQLITSGGFGTMGFGYGAAMGAKVGCPDKVVIHTAGDGCFRMNCHELATSTHYNIPVITLVFNNGTLGMVRQWQTLMYGKRYSQTTLDRGPDFVKLAEAYGANGYRVETAEEFERALRDAIAANKPAVIDCMLWIDETVRPMVPGGAQLTDFILE